MTPGFESKTIDQALAHIIEEAGEVITAFGKAQRFGWDSVNPLLPEKEQESNRDWFLRELKDLEKAIQGFRNWT